MKSIKIALYFPPESTAKPITYHLIKDYNLMVSILQANITAGKGGKTVLEISGTEADAEKGLLYIKDSGINYKIFEKNVIWHEDKCIDCGLCTGVCPSNSLTLDKDTRRLQFDVQKCLLCKACIDTCPMKAIDLDFFD